MPPFPDAVARHLPLHPLELRILLVLAAGESAHGYDIVKRVEAAAGGGERRIYPANLYRRIRDLRARGLVEDAPRPADAGDADPRRRYFRLTALGRAVAREDAARLAGLVEEARRADLLEPA